MTHVVKREPASAPFTPVSTKALYEYLSHVQQPNAEADARIYCWLNGWTLLPKLKANTESGFVFRDATGAVCQQDDAPMFTFSVTEALNLAETVTPGLALALLKHPNGHWSVAWSDDGPPRFDDVHFDPAFLPLAIVASVLEALGNREARKQ